MDEGILQAGQAPSGNNDCQDGFSVLREGRKLREMTNAQLRERYELLFGRPPGAHLTNLHITKRILWRLQEIRFGGLTATAEKVLEEVADDDGPANLKPAKGPRKSRIAGSQIEKVWRCKTYKVTMREDGKVEYGGRIFRSLSAVAKEITGTHWNGKAFFGVK